MQKITFYVGDGQEFSVSIDEVRQALVGTDYVLVKVCGEIDLDA